MTSDCFLLLIKLSLLIMLICTFSLFEISCYEIIIFPLFLFLLPTSFAWSFPFFILCRAGFLGRYWWNLVISLNNLLFLLWWLKDLLDIIESFAGCISLGCHPWSLNTLSLPLKMTFWLSLSPMRIHSVVILIGVPLYFTCLFSFADLNILSLFCTFSGGFHFLKELGVLSFCEFYNALNSLDHKEL